MAKSVFHLTGSRLQFIIDNHGREAVKIGVRGRPDLVEVEEALVAEAIEAEKVAGFDPVAAHKESAAEAGSEEVVEGASEGADTEAAAEEAESEADKDEDEDE